MDLRSVKSKGVVVFLFILMNGENVHSEIVLVPTERIASVYESTYFNCSTSKQPVTDQSIKWFHYPLDRGGQRSDVYDEGIIRSHYINRTTVERNLSSGQINLIFLRLEPKDAGTYKCSDDVLGDDGKSAELTVLESNVVCASNMDPGGVVGPTQCKVPIAPDEVQMSCSVSYNGRNKPQMVWSESEDSSTSYKSNCVTKDNRSVTCNTTLTASLQMSRSIYICKLTTHQYNCSLEIKNISYVFSGHTTLLREIGAEVNCSAKSSQSCRYNWIWTNETHSQTVSTNQTLKPTTVGSHRCEANCDVRNKSCEVDVMFVEVQSTESVQATTGQYWLIPTIVLVILVLVIIIIVSFLVYFLLRHRLGIIVVDAKADAASLPILQAEDEIEYFFNELLQGNWPPISARLQDSVSIIIVNRLRLVRKKNSIAFHFQPNNLQQLTRLRDLLESKELQRHIELIYNEFLSKTLTTVKVHLTWDEAEFQAAESKLHGLGSRTYRTSSAATAVELIELRPRPINETALSIEEESAVCETDGASNPRQPEEHEKRIRLHYSELTKSLNVPEVANKMFESEKLTTQEHQHIRQFRSTPITEGEELLSIIIKSPRDVYDNFLDSLQKTRQTELYQLLTSDETLGLDGLSLSEHSQLIQKNYQWLTEYITPDIDLLGRLYRNDAISHREYDQIDSQRGDSDKIELLLRIISRKPAKDFKTFMNALEETLQGHVAKRLRDTKLGDVNL